MNTSISKLTLAGISVSFILPLFAAAQTGINLAPLTSYKTGIIDLINGILVPVLMAIAFIVFLWGVYKYFILGAAEEKSRTDGRQFTLWGLIGFVVILSVWALVNLIRGTFGLDNNAIAPTPPTFAGSSASFTGGSTVNSSLVTGSPVYNTNGTLRGILNASGNIVSGGVVVGTVVGGQPYDTSGAPICIAPAVVSPDGGCYTPTLTDGGATQYDASGAPICIAPAVVSPDGGCYTPTLSDTVAGPGTYFTCSDGSTAFDIMSCPPASGTCVDEQTGQSYSC